MKTLEPIHAITANDPKPPTDAVRPRLGMASKLARFTLIGALLAAVAGMFAYLGGWCSPDELTPTRFVDGFDHCNRFSFIIFHRNS